MTLLLSWIGRDSRKISSFYIASDSRISWGTATKYDYGRKVFALMNSADILGYCGDVLYPTTVLNQLMDLDRDNILFPANATNQQRSSIVYEKLKEKFDEYPSHLVMKDTLEILHVSRDNETDYLCNVYRWKKKAGWSVSPVSIPDSSDKVIILGTGKKEFFDRYLSYYNGLNGKTSRALFQCLTHSLLKINDPNCGGSPQLVGLFNKFNGKNFGVVYQGKKYYLGAELQSTDNLRNVEWRNELFERCDGNTGIILKGAQRQPDELRP